MNVRDLLGSWELLSCHLVTDGARSEPLGHRPTGYIHYLDNGQMATIIMHEGRQPLSGGRHDSPEPEMAAAARKLDAYGGAYTFHGDRVVHHLAVSSFQNDVGADYLRTVALADNGDLLMGTPDQTTPAGVTSFEMVWRKLPAA